MRSLLWTFWLAMLIAVLGTFASSALLMTQWHRFESYSDAQMRPNVRLQSLAQEIEQTLGNPDALNALLQNNAMSDFGEVFLIDPGGRDVLMRPIPEEIMSSAPDAQNDASPMPPGPPIFARAIRAPDDDLYFMIFQFRKPKHPVWVLFRWFGLTWVLIAAFVISGLVSAGLARIVVRPIQHLAAASRRQGEGELDAEINHSLLQRRDEIGDLSRQLSTSAIKIRQLLQQQQEFVRDVSHEVRTPLARLRVAAETVELDPSDARALQHIQREVDVIDELVQDLLHLAHVDYPLSQPAFEPVAIAGLLQQCIDNVQILAARKELTINRAFDTELQSVDGVPVLLTRAVDNLLTNAVRHAPHGSAISVQCRRNGDWYEIAVEDQGPGVPQESLQAIFEPFVRVDSARQRTTGGFGLGLPLVRRIAELHGGHVCAANIAPTGLAVTLTLPMEREACAI